LLRFAFLHDGNVKTFPGKVRRTADPSVALGMTNKERVVVRRGPLPKDGVVVEAGDPLATFPLATAPLLTTTLSLFVIPSVAEGSAVLRTLPGSVFRQNATVRRL
jgi:hypothetical protein